MNRLSVRAVARGMCTTRSVWARLARDRRLDLLDPDALAQVPVEGPEQVAEALRERVVALVGEGEQAHLTAQLAEVLLEPDVEPQRHTEDLHADPVAGRLARARAASTPVTRPGTPSSSAKRAAGANHTTLPSSSISAPQASALRARRCERPRP